MSEDRPKVTVTRGTKKGRTREGDDASVEALSSGGMPGPMDVVSGVARGVRETWLAGLGVLSVAGETGSEVYRALVEKGEAWETAERKRFRTPRRESRATGDRPQTVEALENRLRDGVDDVLRRIGAPRREEVDELRDRVNSLAQEVERLSHVVKGGDA